MTSDPSSPTLDIDESGVVRIAVSGTAAGNSLDGDALRSATQVLREITRGERDAGAILLTGDGANFCAGGNVRAFAGAAHRPDHLQAVADGFHTFVRVLLDTGLPVVVAVRGWAAGAGMSLVLHADVAVGGTGTRLRPAYRGIGLSPDGGMTWTLPRLIGAGHARRVIMTDQVIDASDALAWGLLAEVVDDAEVGDRALAVATDFATGPRAALAATRTLIADGATRSLTDQLAAEGASIAALSGSAEGVEGVDAFLAKRRPDFAAARRS